MARRARAPLQDSTLFEVAPPAAPDLVPRVLVGLDEAGFGPLLGPLTIGCVALRSPEGPVDPWERLACAVARPGARDVPETARRLWVGDSKAVFERSPRGRARLERTVLAFHAILHGTPADGREFLAATPAPLACPETASEFWYASIGRRLSDAAEEDLAADARSVRDALPSARLELALCAVRVVPAAVLNDSFARTGSKGATHWEQCAPFLAHAWHAFGTEGVDLCVDRHGGRMRYGALLRATFPDARVTVESEIAARSTYRLEGPGGRRMRATFAEKADASSFPVALASCCAKYARETCMEAFNAHFARLQPGLEPTAGYVTDARRWLADAGPALERAGLLPAALVRTR